MKLFEAVAEAGMVMVVDEDTVVACGDTHEPESTQSLQPFFERSVAAVGSCGTYLLIQLDKAA